MFTTNSMGKRDLWVSMEFGENIKKNDLIVLFKYSEVKMGILSQHEIVLLN